VALVRNGNMKIYSYKPPPLVVVSAGKTRTFSEEALPLSQKYKKDIFL